MKIKILSGVLCSGLALAMGHAAAQSSGQVEPKYQIPGSDAEAKEGPKGIPAGEGLIFFPAAAFRVGKDSNLFLTRTGERSSTIYGLTPGFKLEARGQQSRYSLDYAADLARYDNSTADNYNDQRASATAEHGFGSSAGLKLGLTYNSLHDPRGSTDRGISGNPDLYYTTGPSALFAYGGNEAFGRIELAAGREAKRYTNNRASTIASDRDNTNVAGRFFVKIAPKTSLVFEAREEKFDYKLGTSLQDSKERRLYAGITWEATAATTGTIKVGRQKKDFTSATLKDFSGSAWEANMQWTPVSYSKFDFSTAKATSESTGLGDFTLNKKYSVAWTHNWSQRLMSVASLSRADDDFIGGGRNDKTNSVGFKVNYKLTRVWTLGGEVTHTNRDSNQSQYEYKRNLYFLSLGAAL
jgi:hypothetical protein